MGSKIACETDFLEIIETDIATKVDAIKRTYCGDDEPQIYVSSDNNVKIHFKKTVNFDGTGWIINFMAVNEGAKPNSW